VVNKDCRASVPNPQQLRAHIRHPADRPWNITARARSGWNAPRRLGFAQFDPRY